MKVLGIDPGTDKSAWVELHDSDIQASGHWENDRLLEALRLGQFEASEVGIEMVANYGMAVGRSTFETVYWIGRFDQAARENGVATHRLYRKQETGYPAICMHICKSMKAKDKNIRRAIMDMYPGTGGGKTPEVGTAKQPGPLYGVTSHEWQALAVAITLRDHLNGNAGTSKAG